MLDVVFALHQLDEDDDWGDTVRGRASRGGLVG